MIYSIHEIGAIYIYMRIANGLKFTVQHDNIQQYKINKFEEFKKFTSDFEKQKLGKYTPPHTPTHTLFIYIHINIDC